MLIRCEGYAEIVCNTCHAVLKVPRDIENIKDGIFIIKGNTIGAISNAKALTPAWKASKSGMKHTCPECRKAECQKRRLKNE